MEAPPPVPWSQRLRGNARLPSRPPRRRLRLRLWALVPAGAVATLAIGVPALLAWPESGVTNVTGALYATLRMFTLDGPLGGPLPPWVEVARYLAAAVTLSAAVGAALTLLGPRLLRWRLRRWSGHVVVAGLTPEGRRLAEGFLAQRRRVVAIDLPGADGGAGLREQGAAVLVGDPRDPAVLSAAGAGRADLLLATAPDDTVNAEVAVQANRAHAGRSSPLRCFAHVADPALRATLARHAALGHASGAFGLRLFGLADTAARLLLVDGLAHGLSARRGRDAPAHLVVVGLGDVGASVVREAARLPRRPEPRALTVTALDREAPARAAALLRRLPGLDALCALRPVATEEDPAALAAAVAAAERSEPVSAVVACLPDRGATVAAALALRGWCAEHGVPLFARLREERGLADLLAGEGRAVTVFGSADAAGAPDVVVDEALDALARQIHADYVEKHLARGATPAQNPSLVPWEALPETLREANRRQADHVPVKLAAIGCDVEPPAGAAGERFAFRPDEVEALAVLEHARWAADRLLEGWTFAPGPKDVARRTSPHLVPWSDLSEDLREADREPVRAIPSHLARLGLRIVRRS